MPLAGLFVAIGPLAAQQAEFIEERISQVIEDDAQGGWDVGAIQAALDRTDPFMTPVIAGLTGTAILAMILALHQLGTIVPLDAPWQWVSSLVVMAQMGLVGACGLWGCLKAAHVVMTAAATTRLRWHPFRVRSSPAADFISTAFARIGILLSCGSLFVPSLLAVQGELNPVSRGIVLSFCSFLLLGGLVFFAFPGLLLFRAMSQLRREELDSLAPPIEALVDSLRNASHLSTSDIEHTRASLAALLEVRRSIAEVAVIGSAARLVLRGTRTLVLPTAMSVVQVVVHQH
jgi:hypothetical protein